MKKLVRGLVAASLLSGVSVAAQAAGAPALPAPGLGPVVSLLGDLKLAGGPIVNPVFAALGSSVGPHTPASGALFTVLGTLAHSQSAPGLPALPGLPPLPGLQ